MSWRTGGRSRPRKGWTSDDLDRIPGLPSHTELIYGSLVARSPQTAFHVRTARLLDNALLAQVPDHIDVDREMTVRLDNKSWPEPDIVVFAVEAVTGPDQTWYEPEHIVLAVEAVSADSRERDREVKPCKYAAAGVHHFWRVEQDDSGIPVVHVYELDPATKSYGLTGIFHDRLKVSVPFDVEIDLTAINRRGGES